jgi:DNA-directed RNA polymerase specialized sigma24 family protein
MGIRMDKSLDKMSLISLADCSVREMGKFRHKEPCDDAYCLEIFRRAVMKNDNEAWALLQRLFSDNIRAWLGGHSQREIALRYEVEQTYVDDTFRRFWQAVSDQSLSFSTLGSALSYLRLCLHCAIMDTLRAHARRNVERIPDYGHPDEPQVEDHYHENDLWEAIKSILPGEKEQRVAYLHFHCNLKPREIIRYCPGEFKSEEEIYRLKRNIMERVLRNADKLRWKLDGFVSA